MRLLWNAAQEFPFGSQHVGLRPNDKDQALRSVADRLRWEQVGLPGAAFRSGAGRRRRDLVFSPALGAPLVSPAPVVAYVNDLIPLRDPQQFHGFAAWYWQRCLPATWRRACVITVSNASLISEVSSGLQFPPERIHVVPYYPSPELQRIAQNLKARCPIPPQLGEVRKHFVTLGSHEARKNLGLAIEAAATLRQRGLAVQLTCIGSHGMHTAGLEALARSLGVADAIHFPGYITAEQCVELLLTAAALVSPSIHERFGLPPLEAMSLGCPAIISSIPSHLEVYGRTPGFNGPAAALFDPEDASALADLMQRVVLDPPWRADLVRRGLALAGSLTLEQTARALSTAFRAALT